MLNNTHFLWATLLMVAVLTGCSVLPEQRGMADVNSIVNARSGLHIDDLAQTPTIDSAKIVSTPLTLESATRAALLNNARVRREYVRLGLAGADVYDAGRLSNPRLSFATLSSTAAGAADQVTFGLAQSFTDLLLLPARTRLAKGEFERTKLQVGHVILELVTDVSLAYYKLAAAQKLVALRGKIADAAQATADFAQRLFAAGNISARELAQDKAAGTAARLGALQSQSELWLARVAFADVLGLRGDSTQALETAEPLPAPLNTDDDPTVLIKLADQSRLDLAAQRWEVALLRDSLQTARRYRLLGSVDVGAETERETDHSRITGPSLTLELPLFNQGSGKVARAEALVEQAESRLKSLEVGIANQITATTVRVTNARQQANLLRTELIPQREEIVKRTQQEVSYMLEGQFNLLLAKQQAYDAYQSYFEALRDYWLARTELVRAVGTRLPTPTSASTESSHTPTSSPFDDSMTDMAGMSMHDMPTEGSPPKTILPQVNEMPVHAQGDTP